MRGQGRIIASLVAALALVHAQAAGATSPYYHSRPAAYAYGNFCGAQLPHQDAKPGKDIDARIRRIQEIAPVDSVDELCRGHDLCYELFGQGSFDCDAALSTAARRMAFNWEGRSIAGVTLAQQCRDLLREISTDAEHLRPNTNHSPQVFISKAFASAIRAFDGLGEAKAGSAGWPKPGECQAPPVARDAAHASAMKYFAEMYAAEVCAAWQLGCGARQRKYAAEHFSSGDIFGATALSRTKFAAMLSTSKRNN